MKLKSNTYYLFHNKAVYSQHLFLNNNDFYFFMQLFDKYVQPHCTVHAWCLLPDAFYFLIKIEPSSLIKIKIGSIKMTRFSNGVRLMQSNYTQVFNIQNKRTGSLFNPKAKNILAESFQNYYASSIVDRILLLPVHEGYVLKVTQWPYSSASSNAQFQVLKNY